MARVLGLEKDRIGVSKEKNDEYASKLTQMINCKTVFTTEGTYSKEFDKFYKVIKNNFPLISKKAKRIVFGSGAFLYLIEGKNAYKNIMLMSHHDVVDKTPGWKTDPFKAVIIDDKMYGRGTVDTKTSLFAELQAIEELLQEGYEFEGINVYIGSSNNEEVSGDGMVLVSKYFKEHNIHIDTILDEGGAIVSKMVPGYQGKSAMIAIHEKGRFMYKCVAKKESKGHTSLNPSDDSVVLRMSSFIKEVSEANIFSSHFYPEVIGTFKAHAPYLSFPFNTLFKNFNIFSPVIKKIMEKSPQTKAMLTTSIKFTASFAGDKNALYADPTTANSVMYLRCVREEDINKNFYKINKIAKKYGIEISLLSRDYCEPSTDKTYGYKILKETLNKNYPDVVVAPFLLTAGTDARRFSDVATSILRFAPIDLNPEQFASIHNDNEYIHLKTIGECVCFYKSFVKNYSENLK